ncbi:MAG: tRNA (adenosine(37)-N6)-threonylcarbamoyltransferase complex dimerization subunit type 1 TsaB [Balneolaceae bacterium]
MILALETATNICSVSFQNNEGEILEKRLERRGSHSEYLFLFIRELMQEHNFQISDLQTVLISNGPGSYTGLRIAASAAKGFLFGLNVNVFAANTLAGFAEGVPKKSKTGSIHAVINARRSHLYHQQFIYDGNLTASSEAQILDLKEIEDKIKTGDILIGTGIERLDERPRANVTEFGLETITASSLITLFNREPESGFFTKTTAEELESNYISSSQV